MASASILDVQSLSCPFQPTLALENITFSVRESEMVCLLGPRGGGKTALLRALAGLAPITGGAVMVAGERVSAPDVLVPPAQRSVGLVFSDHALFPHLNVAKNLAFGLYGQDGRAVAKATAEMLALMRLEGCETRYPHELTPEQRLRVAIARALVSRPRLLLLDAPFPVMDSRRRDLLIADVRQTLKQRRVAALFATHSREEAFVWADHVVLLEEGRVAQQGYPSELYQRPNSRFVADFMGKTNYLAVKILSEQRWQSILGEHQAAHALDYPVGSECDWLVRPQDVALALDPEGPALIEDRLFMGTSHHYRVRLDGALIDVQTGNWFEPGQLVRLSIKAERPVLFPAASPVNL